MGLLKNPQRHSSQNKERRKEKKRGVSAVAFREATEFRPGGKGGRQPGRFPRQTQPAQKRASPVYSHFKTSTTTDNKPYLSWS